MTAAALLLTPDVLLLLLVEPVPLEAVLFFGSSLIKSRQALLRSARWVSDSLENKGSSKDG